MKSEKKLSVYENLIWNTIGSFTYLICQWLLTLIVVRVSDGFGNAGNLALAISVTNIFFNLACFNVNNIVRSVFFHVQVQCFCVLFIVAFLGIQKNKCSVLCYIWYLNLQRHGLICIMDLNKESHGWI